MYDEYDSGKVVSAILLTLEALAVTAAFSVANLFICAFTAWFAYITWGIASIIEGVVLHSRSRDRDILSEPVRFLCTYAPVMAAAVYLRMTAPNTGALAAFSLFYFWTAVGITATGLLCSVCVWLWMFVKKRRALKESRIPKIPYSPDQINADDFFNDKHR